MSKFDSCVYSDVEYSTRICNHPKNKCYIDANACRRCTLHKLRNSVVKKCKFCNSSADVRLKEFVNGRWYLRCNGCGIWSSFKKTIEEAIDNWNKRS